MSEPRTTVPKFGSFRPTPTPLSEAPTTTDLEKERRASSDKHEARGQEDKKSRHNHRHHKPRRKESYRQSPEIEPPRHPLEESPPDAFVIDTKGDEKNLIYGSLHRYSIPAFYRIGSGSVLGVPSYLKVDRDHGEHKGIILRDWRDSGSNRREKYAFSRVERERPRLLRVRPEATIQDPKGPSAEFISFSANGKKRKRKREDDTEVSESEDDETHYRSIHGKMKPSDRPVDDAFEFASETDSGSEAGTAIMPNTSARQRNVELSRRVEQEPHEIESWLALIQMQDILVQGADDHRRPTNAEIMSTTDIKIHMYEKALGYATSLDDRETLLVGLMAEGSKIWDTKVQSERWEKISKENIDSLMLWKGYLAFKQSAFSTFRYEDIREIFDQRIKLLLKGTSTAEPGKVASLYRQLIYVLLRASIFIHESGYSELGVAIWQGLLEINFCCPKLPPSQNERAKLFNDFWESETPRIGDDGALGWRYFVENEATLEAPPSTADEATAPLDTTNLFKGWATAERLRSSPSILPARTMDDVVEDDPFRVILHSDIKDFLITLPHDAQDLHKVLLNAFMIFCRLPPIDHSKREAHDLWLNDAFTKGELLELDPNVLLKHESPSKNDGENIDVFSMMDLPLPNYVISPETLFSSTAWFQGGAIWRAQYTEAFFYKWVRNTLQQLTLLHFREDLAEYYLGFQWRNEPATIKKVSKGLLRQHPTSLRLYNAYAMVEWGRGNKEAANGVFSAALRMSGSMSTNDNKDAILLWKSWVWAHIESSDKSTALQHILSIPEGLPNNSTTPSSTSILKAKQYLTSTRDHLMSSGDYRYAVTFGEIVALLEYLMSNASLETQSNVQGDITSALTSYIGVSKDFINRGLSTNVSHELLLQSATRLLYHHARIGPFRPALIREHLTNFIVLFPHNTILLCVYTWNESRLRIDNRVRNTLLSTVLAPSNDTLTSRLFAISYEMQHGTIHSVRSTFENSLSSPSSKSSAGLWRYYILYCLETPQFREQAKDVWYRAIRACPWAKELYIIGFERLDRLIGFEDLKRTWRVMGEKDLRVHVDLEEMFEAIDDVEKDGRVPRSLEFR